MPAFTPRSSTAHLVLEALRAADEPPTTTQLAASTGLRASVVRHHLRLMRDAGAVAQVEQCGDTSVRGRPALTWRLRPAVDVCAIASIASALARAHGDAIESPATVAAITALGRQLASAHHGGSLQSVREGLVRLGFAPRAFRGDDGAEHIMLDECPFVDAERGVVDLAMCRVHGMLVTGMAGPDHRIDHIEVSPTGKGCILCLEHVRRSTAPRPTMIDIRPAGGEPER